MKRAHKGDDSFLSFITKYEVCEKSLKVSNENNEDHQNLDLEIFEKNPIWTDDYLSKVNIRRRPFDFQIEIVQSVIKNGNSIICLRTGAGKTYIAALLIKYFYLKKKKETNGKFLSFFFVPHRSIRDQQTTAIRDVGDLRVISCDDDSSANEFIQLNHVIVCTPQKFVNCLNDKTIHFNQIDLLIFDECHNCIGNHPYSKIMKQYLVNYSSGHQPKIIGLTASCGTKLTNSQSIFEELSNEQTRKKNALKKLYELCATLNCYDAVTITKTENLDELNKKVPNPTNDEIRVVDSMSFDQYLNNLKQTLESLLNYIGSRCSPSINGSTNETDLVELRKKAEEINNYTNVVLINYMIMFVKRLNALNDLPLKPIMDDIIKKIDSFYNQKETPIEIETEIHDYCLKAINNIIEQLKQSQYYLTNPKLDFLTNLLKQLIEEKNDARGLILVSRTVHAKLIFDYFNERQDIQNIINPCWLVGQTGVDYQNTLSEQDKTLKDFRQGLSNVMIATDIVQEGLDVPQCSFVIRYEFVSNEIGTVQSRGRARADKSSCFLIVDQNSINYKKEMKNRLKEVEMHEALNDWKQIPSDQLKQNIIRIQNIIVDEWRFEAQQQDQSRSLLKDSEMIDGKFSCRSCDHYMGEVSWLCKRNNNYFVRQQQFIEQVKLERYNEPKVFKEIQVNGKVWCGNTQCCAELGGIQQFTDRPDIKELCTLKCKQLKFSIKNEKNVYQVSIYKKWTDVPFKILEI